MTRKLAGAVVVLVAGLALGACGSASKTVPATGVAIVKRAPTTVTVWVPVAQRVTKTSGTGTKTIGPFAFHGQLSITLSCKGRGNLNLEIQSSPSIPGLGTVCPESGMGLGAQADDLAHLKVKPSTGFADRLRHAQITVDAPSRVHWTIAAQEIYAKPSVVPAGLQQLPLRRTGVGPESLGTFSLTHGAFYVAGRCVGKGTIGLWFNRPELGMSGACLNSRYKATLKSVSSPVTEHRARIDVLAPLGMKWTIVVFQGPWPGPANDPTNIWR